MIIYILMTEYNWVIHTNKVFVNPENMCWIIIEEFLNVFCIND